MAQINEQFILVKTRANFEARLEAGDIKDTSIAFIEDEDQIWAKGRYYSVVPKNGHERQILSWKGEGQAMWEDMSNLFTGMEELLAYGVEWDVTVADPHLTRIGNMSFHKTLPILSQLKGCIALKDKVIYWLDENDWRWRKTPITKTVTLALPDSVYTVTSDIFATKLYEKQWIKIKNVACQIDSVQTDSNTATLVTTYELVALALESGDIEVELGAVLNGYDGTVRVYCPNFYIKSVIDGNKRRVWLSTTKIDNTWTYQHEILLDAYRNTVLNTVPNNMGYLSTLPINSAISVVNTATYCRGGGNRTNTDIYLTGTENTVIDIFRTDLGKPRTYLYRSTMRSYSRNTGNEMLSYELYKNIFYWLYVVEYANFNCLETYNAELTAEGYHQGGLGSGITNMSNWKKYNNEFPLTPCGYGNEFGNFTGIKDLVIPEFTYTKLSIWFNNWTMNNNICASYDSANNGKMITKVLRTDNYAGYCNADKVWGSTKYVIDGLTDGQKVIFKEGGGGYSDAVTLLEVSENGTYTVNWSEYNTNDPKYIGFEIVQELCNISIYNTNINAINLTNFSQTFKMPRWRGFDNPFGDILTNLDGIIIDADANNHPNNMNYVYTCKDPSKFGDTLTEYYEKVGEEIRQFGYTKIFDLGEAAHIIPNVIGGTATKYKCDYHETGAANNILRTLMVGGSGGSDSHAGLGNFISTVDGPINAAGFRSASAFLASYEAI